MANTEVLFLCTQNAARSQMAEALMHYRVNDIYKVYSAGTCPATTINPMTFEVLEEIGADISMLRSPKSCKTLGVGRFDYAFILCEDDLSSCSGVGDAITRVHWQVPDPIKIDGTVEHQREAFRRARDELLMLIDEFINLEKTRDWEKLSVKTKEIQLEAVHERLFPNVVTDTASVSSSTDSAPQADDIKEQQILNIELDQAELEEEHQRLSQADSASVHAKSDQSSRTHESLSFAPRITGVLGAILRLLRLDISQSGRANQVPHTTEKAKRMRERSSGERKGRLVVTSFRKSEDGVGYEVDYHYDPDQPIISESMRDNLLRNAPTDRIRKEWEKKIDEASSSARKKT